ncbi:uncharacterized protein LOC122394028 [Amphibalanus amphitrite]|uniref:uncharacterized protein LOC122394028 n=1 Tax=Amphibalanus amphitrite TaxID=1232801 RepID=UPI001C91D5BD|nr:uncharacterized protein LOC122394028 [Amphibalanus amphitrite]
MLFTVHASTTPLAEQLAALSVSLQHIASGEIVSTQPVPPPKPSSKPVPPLSATFLCDYVELGGRYSALLLTSGRLLAFSAPLFVRWPPILVTLPSRAETHTSVVAHVRKFKGLCAARSKSQLSVSAQLVVSRRGWEEGNVAVSEPLLGSVTDRFPLQHFYARIHDIRIPCDRLDRQGFFQLQLVTNSSDSSLIAWSNVTRVEWNRTFKLYARGETGASVFPCLSGVEVYYRRPKCGAVSGMVRVAGVERAAVESAVPPTTRHYVGEMRVADYTSAMSFRCDMFSERFQEYCFSYVTFGWNGSVHTVKTVCLSTLMPILRTDGGFGPWSPWSPCRTSCGAASSVRYRFCNSPPPRNNGAYCQGEGIQVRRCALPPCPTPPVTLSPVQKAYVSPTCRCGCDVVLSRGQNYSVAAATGRCSAPSLWRFETTEGNVLSLHFSYFLLNTSSERLYARDGPYSNSELLVGGRGATLPPPVVSSGNFLLLEYIGGPASAAHPAGGFLASVAAVASNRSGGVQLAMAGSERPGLPTVGVLSIALLTVILVVLLGAAFYHAWQARRVARSHSCESLFSSADDADGGGGVGSGGAGWVSLHTSVTSIAESTVILRLRRGPRRKRPPLRTSSCDRLLAADWHRSSTASAGCSLPSSPATERRRLAARVSRLAGDKRPEAIPLSCLKSTRCRSQALEKRSEAEDSPESTEKYRPHTKPASKRWKDRENRRRLLVRSESADTLKPTVSESALSTALSSAVSSALSSASTAALSTADQELELDYYDYHMANASLAPGSIFGMDPLQLSLCAYDFDVTPTEELELGEMSELGTTEATQVTEVATEGAATDAELTELTEVAEEVTDRTEVGDDIQFADDTDDEGSLKDEHDSPASVLEDKE